MKKLLFFSALFVAALFARSQDLRMGYFVTPGLTAGYTFGAGLNYGLTLDMGMSLKGKDERVYRVGNSIAYYFVHTKRHTHRLRSFNLLLQNDFARLCVGTGRARNRWGYGKRNKCVVRGANFDLSVRPVASAYAPWLGFRRFVYPAAQWAWFNRPYNSLYASFSYPVSGDMQPGSATGPIFK
jgi:hypothetical protein